MCSIAVDDALASLEAALDAVAAGVSPVGDSARLDRVRRVTADAVRVVTVLEAAADQTSVRPAPAGTSLLVDAAFLVPKRRRATFRRALEAQAAPLLAEGCSVSLTGPWPPYSFASTE